MAGWKQPGPTHSFTWCFSSGSFERTETCFLEYNNKSKPNLNRLSAFDFLVAQYYSQPILQLCRLSAALIQTPKSWGSTCEPHVFPPETAESWPGHSHCATLLSEPLIHTMALTYCNTLMLNLIMLYGPASLLQTLLANKDYGNSINQDNGRNSHLAQARHLRHVPKQCLNDFN
jgi:hypothetical protein